MKLLHGDCLELLKTIPDGSIDLVVTSPPYDNLRTYNNTCVWDSSIWQSVIKSLYRVIKQGGVVVWIVNDSTLNGNKTGTSFRQALYFKKCGFNLHDTMIWNKNSWTATGSLKVRYGQVFEYMFIFSKGKLKTFNPIKDRLNKSYGQKLHGTIRQKDGIRKKFSNSGKIIKEYGQRFNVWELPACMSPIERTGHPAQFPERLAHDHIISWSNNRDVVLDPFMGSGTTGVACVNLDRDFIGMEIERKYFIDANRRIGAAIVKRNYLEEACS